jgi:hypothetical protein
LLLWGPILKGGKVALSSDRKSDISGQTDSRWFRRNGDEEDHIICTWKIYEVDRGLESFVKFTERQKRTANGNSGRRLVPRGYESLGG